MLSRSPIASVLVAIAINAVVVVTAERTPSTLVPVTAGDSLAVVVNRTNPQNDLTIGEVRRFLLGEVTRWPDGRKVTVVMREPGASERDAALRVICRMSETDFTRYLLHAAYRGDSNAAPKQLDTSLGVRR